MKTLDAQPPALQSTACRVEVSQALFSALGKNRVTFPSARKEKLNYFFTKLASWPGGKGGVKGHDLQINVFQCHIFCVSHIFSFPPYGGVGRGWMGTTPLLHQKAVREANVGLRRVTKYEIFISRFLKSIFSTSELRTLTVKM